ncbi:MAG: CbiX/SirB N-terminal domain-containing protein [Hyphomicrobiaceae bacterium]
MSKAAGTGIGVVIVGHGERGGNADNRVLLKLRDGVAAAIGLATVEAGVLNGEPTFEHALDALARAGCRELLIYPFFMSGGYFVRTAVPDRIARVGVPLPWHMLTPLGLDPALPTVIHRRALADAQLAGWIPSNTRLLLVGHGSTKSRASAEATDNAAVAVAAFGQFNVVETAFLEEPPFIVDRIGRDRGQTLVIGFFSAEGLHARDDIPEAIAGTDAHYSGPIGAEPAIVELAAAAIRNAIADG